MTRAPNAPTYSGKPCAKGHDGTRYRSTRACVDCMRERQAARPPRDYSLDARRKAKRSKIQGETPDAACAPSPVAAHRSPTMAGGLLDGATLDGLDARALGVALAAALEAHGRAHLALTRLDSGLWQAVALRLGYRDQVTRCAADPGEALGLALTGTRARSDELLDVVG